MVDVIMDQRLLRIHDRALDGLQLLGQLDAWPAILDHLDDHLQVAVGALEALDDLGMVLVDHGFPLSRGEDSNDPPWRIAENPWQPHGPIVRLSPAPSRAVP